MMLYLQITSTTLLHQSHGRRDQLVTPSSHWLLGKSFPQPAPSRCTRFLCSRCTQNLLIALVALYDVSTTLGGWEAKLNSADSFFFGGVGSLLTVDSTDVSRQAKPVTGESAPSPLHTSAAITHVKLADGWKQTLHFIFFQFSFTDKLLFFIKRFYKLVYIVCILLSQTFLSQSFLPFLVKQKTNSNTKNIITTHEQKIEKKKMKKKYFKNKLNKLKLKKCNYKKQKLKLNNKKNK